MNNTPWTMRPVVSTSGKMMAGLSKWLDHWLKKICHQVPTYLKDSSHLIKILKDQGTLLPGAKLFTAYAKSMYTNIDTDHGTSQVVGWMEEYHEELPTDFPTEALKEALKLGIHNNIFEFGDYFFEQLSGCSMGKPDACIYATIYYTYHERKALLQKYKNNLLFFKRCIDDMLSI